jgi:hypothetical protein
MSGSAAKVRLSVVMSGNSAYIEADKLAKHLDRSMMGVAKRWEKHFSDGVKTILGSIKALEKTGIADLAKSVGRIDTSLGKIGQTLRKTTPLLKAVADTAKLLRKEMEAADKAASRLQKGGKGVKGNGLGLGLQGKGFLDEAVANRMAGVILKGLGAAGSAGTKQIVKELQQINASLKSLKGGGGGGGGGGGKKRGGWNAIAPGSAALRALGAFEEDTTDVFSKTGQGRTVSLSDLLGNKAQVRYKVSKGGQLRKESVRVSTRDLSKVDAVQSVIDAYLQSRGLAGAGTIQDRGVQGSSGYRQYSEKFFDAMNRKILSRNYSVDQSGRTQAVSLIERDAPAMRARKALRPPPLPRDYLNGLQVRGGNESIERYRNANGFDAVVNSTRVLKNGVDALTLTYKNSRGQLLQWNQALGTATVKTAKAKLSPAEAAKQVGDALRYAQQRGLKFMGARDVYDAKGNLQTEHTYGKEKGIFSDKETLKVNLSSGKWSSQISDARSAWMKFVDALKVGGSTVGKSLNYAFLPITGITKLLTSPKLASFFYIATKLKDIGEAVFVDPIKAIEGRVRNTTEQFREFQVSIAGSVGGFRRAGQVNRAIAGASLGLPTTLEGLQDAARQQAFIPSEAPRLARGSIDDVKQQVGDFAKTLNKLAIIDPQQGIQGAGVAVREFLAGESRSLRFRFEIEPSQMAAMIGKSLSEVEKDPALAKKALKAFTDIFVPDSSLNELNKLVSMQVQHFQDAISYGVSKIGEGGYFDVLSKKWQRLTQNLFEYFDSGDFDKQAQRISDAFVRILDNVGSAIDHFAQGITGQKDALGTVGGSIEILTSMIEKISRASDFLPSIMEAVGEGARQAGHWILEMANNLGELFNRIDRFMSKGLLGSLRELLLGDGQSNPIAALSLNTMAAPVIAANMINQNKNKIAGGALQMAMAVATPTYKTLFGSDGLPFAQGSTGSPAASAAAAGVSAPVGRQSPMTDDLFAARLERILTYGNAEFGPAMSGVIEAFGKSITEGKREKTPLEQYVTDAGVRLNANRGTASQRVDLENFPVDLMRVRDSRINEINEGSGELQAMLSSESNPIRRMLLQAGLLYQQGGKSVFPNSAFMSRIPSLAKASVNGKAGEALKMYGTQSALAMSGIDMGIVLKGQSELSPGNYNDYVMSVINGTSPMQRQGARILNATGVEGAKLGYGSYKEQLDRLTILRAALDSNSSRYDQMGQKGLYGVTSPASMLKAGVLARFSDYQSSGGELASLRGSGVVMKAEQEYALALGDYTKAITGTNAEEQVLTRKRLDTAQTLLLDAYTKERDLRDKVVESLRDLTSKGPEMTYGGYLDYLKLNSVNPATMTLRESQVYSEGDLSARLADIERAKTMGFVNKSMRASGISAAYGGRLDDRQALEAQLGAYQDALAAQGGILSKAQSAYAANPLDKQNLQTLDQATLKYAELNAKVKETKFALNDAAKAWMEFGVSLRSSIESGLGDAIYNLITQTGSLSDAFKSMAMSIIRSFSDMQAKLIMQQLFGNLLQPQSNGTAGTGTGGALNNGGFLSGLAGAIGGLFTGYASGGVIDSPTYVVGERRDRVPEAVTPMLGPGRTIPLGLDGGGFHARLPGGRRIPATLMADGGIMGGAPLAGHHAISVDGSGGTTVNNHVIVVSDERQAERERSKITAKDRAAIISIVGKNFSSGGSARHAMRRRPG